MGEVLPTSNRNDFGPIIIGMVDEVGSDRLHEASERFMIVSRTSGNSARSVSIIKTVSKALGSSRTLVQHVRALGWSTAKLLRFIGQHLKAQRPATCNQTSLFFIDRR